MTSYHPHGVKLSENQKVKFARAVKNNSAITIRLARNDLTGPDQLMLTKTRMKRIQRAARNGTGADVKISKTQIRKAVQEGGSFGLHYSHLELECYRMLQKQQQVPYPDWPILVLTKYLEKGKLEVL